jgi:hypothetical protein
MDKIGALKKLKSLLDAGVLTEDEFIRQKKLILDNYASSTIDKKTTSSLVRNTDNNEESENNNNSEGFVSPPTVEYQPGEREKGLTVLIVVVLLIILILIVLEIFS